jgi:signal transduction histidine kinase
MAKIVDNLLLLAEVDSGKLEQTEPVRLKEVIEEELKRARPLAGKRQLAISRQEDLVVNGDPHRLRRLLGNMLDNAIKYTLEDGTITISLFRDGDWALLEVADNGIGIAPQDLPQIFSRFYRVTSTRPQVKGGAGLGLALVKEIAEQHGGMVTVTSELGKESTFTVWLKL